MVKKKKNLLKKIDEEFFWDKKTVGHFFLGIGLILFILNITTILNIIQVNFMTYPLTGYYTSTAGSVFLMAYSLYNIYTND